MERHVLLRDINRSPVLRSHNVETAHPLLIRERCPVHAVNLSHNYVSLFEECATGLPASGILPPLDTLAGKGGSIHTHTMREESRDAVTVFRQATIHALLAKYRHKVRATVRRALYILNQENETKPAVRDLEERHEENLRMKIVSIISKLSNALKICHPQISVIHPLLSRDSESAPVVSSILFVVLYSHQKSADDRRVVSDSAVRGRSVTRLCILVHYVKTECLVAMSPLEA